MKMKDQDYTLRVLKMVINKDLDNSISTSMPDLESLELNRDQFVWKIATKIYTRSGHKVELPMVRDLVDSKIRDVKSQLTKDQQVREHAQRKNQIAPKVDSTRGIFVKICSVICGCTDVSANRVSMGSRIYDLADKHEFSQILINLEKTFDIEIPAEAAKEIQTVKHIVDLIDGRLGARAKDARTQDLYALLTR